MFKRLLTIFAPKHSTSQKGKMNSQEKDMRIESPDIKLKEVMQGEAEFWNQAIRMPRYNSKREPLLGNILEDLWGVEPQLVRSGWIVYTDLAYQTRTEMFATKEEALAFNLLDTIVWRKDGKFCRTQPGANVTITLLLANNQS